MAHGPTRLNINNISGTVSLPSGASTSAKQDSIISELQSVNTNKLNESTFTGRLGEVSSSPTANTLLGRLKSIEDKLNSLQTELEQKTEPSNTQTVSGTVAVTHTGLTELADAINSSKVDVNVASGTVAATQSGTWNINNISGAVSLPTGAATLAEQQTQTTALQLIDDVIATTGSAIPTKGAVISGTDGTNARVIKTDSSGELQIDVLSIAAGTNNIGDVDVLTVPSDPFGSNSDAASATGSISAKLRHLAANGIAGMTSLPAGTNAIGKLAANDGVDIGDVDVKSVTPGTSATSLGKAEDDAHASGDVGVMSLAVANESNVSRAANNDYVPIASDTEGNIRVIGNRAHDAVDAGNPVKIGLKAVAHGLTPTAVDHGDRTDWYANRHGIPFTLGGHPNLQTIQFNITDADGEQNNLALVNVGAGARIVVTCIQAMADGANTQDVGLRIGFGTTTTPANDSAKIIMSHPGLKAGSGIVVGNGSGIIGVGADNEDLRITCEDPVGGALDVIVHYFTIES